MPYDAKADPNADATPGASSFGRKGDLVTPSDSTDLAVYAKSIVILAAGDVKIIPVENGDAFPLQFTGLSAGTVLPFQVRRVMATGTTATVASILG